MRSRRSRLAVITVGAGVVAITCAMTVAYLQRRLPEDGINASGYLQLLSHPLRLLKPPTP
jgi:ABC-type Fe3+ transport system permease subunit